MSREFTDVFRTRAGWMGAVYSEKGLRLLVLPREEREEAENVVAESCGDGGRRKTWQDLRRRDGLHGAAGTALNLLLL